MSKYGEPVFGTVRDEHPVTETTLGKVLGENRNGVAIFRGIPYGGKVDGKNRFLPPTPAESWVGVRDCTKNGPIAEQNATSIATSWDFGAYFSGGHPELFGVDDEVKSENCLVLNVLTPGIDDRKRAVLVYIHGGGFATGSGTTVIGADKLVREQDIVLIGINHRLNVFGALHLGEFNEKYKESGMVGMLDLVQALEWIRDNVAAFGGDPDKVTIMGESGGGGKVNTLNAMPKARGLFRASIVESGSGIPARRSIADGTETAERFLYSLGIRPNELNKLTELPTHHIRDAAISMGLMNFGPIADGINLQLNPTGYDVCDPSLPLLVGASEDEMAAFVSETEYKIETLEQVKDFLTNREGRRDAIMGMPMSEKQAEHAIQVFSQHNVKNDAPDHLYMKIRSLTGMMGGGAILQALDRVSKENAGPVFNYLVSYDAPHRIIPSKFYSWHTADLPMQFRIVLHPEMEWLSRIFSNMWGAFVRDLNPSIEGYQWPAFTAEKRDVMVFDNEIRVEQDPTAPFRDL